MRLTRLRIQSIIDATAPVWILAIGIILGVGAYTIAPRAVVPLDYHVDIRGEGFTGSGILVGPRTVLTAAHVGRLEPTEVEGPDGTSGVLYHVESTEADVGFIVLEEPVGDGPYARLWCDDPSPGDAIRVVGNPRGMGVFMLEGSVAGEPIPSGVPVTVLAWPGMSGGGVYDSGGWLRGITSSIAKWTRSTPLGPITQHTGISAIVAPSLICDWLDEALPVVPRS